MGNRDVEAKRFLKIVKSCMETVYLSNKNLMFYVIVLIFATKKIKSLFSIILFERRMIDPSWLIIILLSILILQASYLIVRKPKVVIDPNAISAIIGNALSEVVGRVSGEIGRAIGKLEEFDRNLSVTRETLPENVRKYISELRNDLVEFRNELNSLPESVLRSIQGSIDVRKGKVGELATLMRLLGQYDRIIPLGKPVDFIGIGEYIDFIETKTGSSNLTEEQRRIRDLIRSRKVRFIVRREDVEVITPEEVLESPQSASEVLKEVGVGEG